MNDLLKPNYHVPNSMVMATPTSYPLCKNEEEAIIYLSMLLHNDFCYSNATSYDLIDYEKLFYIEYEFSSSEKISELLKAIKQEIAETYIYKQKYLVRLCDYQTDIDNIDRDPHDGYLDLPDKMFRQ